jgi:hypothetical protein
LPQSSPPIAQILAQKTILDLIVDFVQPLLCAFGLLPVRFGLGLEIGNALFGCSELVRKLLRSVDCMSAILLGYIGGSVEKLEDRLTRLIELMSLRLRVLTLARQRNDIWAGSHTVLLCHLGSSRSLN